MAANIERHHAAPRCLLRLHDAAQEELRIAGVGLWVEYETECRRWGVEVEISRDDLARLIERSTEVIEREKHRIIHSTDWQRWGRRGGMTTLRRHGSDHFVKLALLRWGRITRQQYESGLVVR